MRKLRIEHSIGLKNRIRLRHGAGLKNSIRLKHGAALLALLCSALLCRTLRGSGSEREEGGSYGASASYEAPASYGAPSSDNAGGVKGAVAGRIQERAYRTYFPVFSFVWKDAGEGETSSFLTGILGNVFPLYEYAGSVYASSQAAFGVYGADGAPPGYSDFTGNGALTEDNALSGDETWKEENEGVFEEEIDLIEAVKRENENEESGEADEEDAEPEFAEANKAETIDMTELSDFDTLVSRFYAVDSTTYIDREQLNIKKLTEKDMSLAQTDASKPQILIYHTHSQEGFADSVPGDDATTIMGVGERLAEILREKYGYNVIHHMGKYDVESRDYAYSNAAPDLEQVLAENPSVEVIIDLHRDEVPADRHLVTEVGGRQTAQFMFFNGLSRTTRTGEIEYLKNPNLEENLAFSFQMQRVSCEYYPGLTRKIYLKGYRYNMHYRGKTLLVELGAQNNTLEEAMNACDPLAHILSLVLSGEE